MAKSYEVTGGAFEALVALLVLSRHGAISVEQIFSDFLAGNFRHSVGGHVVSGDFDTVEGVWRLDIQISPRGPVKFEREIMETLKLNRAS